MSAYSPMASASFAGLHDEAASAEPHRGDESLGTAVTGSRAPVVISANAAAMPSVHTAPSIRTANSVLASSSVAELRYLRVDEDEEAIHLSGRVRSFYHKQLAQEAIRPIAAGRQVINRVDVCNYT